MKRLKQLNEISKLPLVNPNSKQYTRRTTAVKRFLLIMIAFNLYRAMLIWANAIFGLDYCGEKAHSIDILEMQSENKSVNLNNLLNAI